jgi:CMP-N-acetylneuraminic acid synthetase
MKTICIILARGGSKGLKNKNLRKLNNKPLIYYPIYYAKKSKVIDNIVVSTDSQTIAKVARSFGAEVPFIRPKKLALDSTTTESSLKHALISYETLHKTKFDICVFLTATDVFRETKWITNSVKILKKNKNIESVFSGYKTHKNFWEWNKRSKKWIRIRPWMKKYASRQIKKNKIIREDTGLACASKASLWRKGKRIGDKVHILINEDSFSSIDIHDKNDLDLANFAYKLRFKKK